MQGPEKGPDTAVVRPCSKEKLRVPSRVQHGQIYIFNDYSVSHRSKVTL